MRVTVVVITKNQRAYLERSLPMIARQTGVPGGVETVVVDSGSTDGALEVVRRHEATLVSIAAASFGYARAYNIGAAAGTGDLLVRLSGDAVPANDRWLARLTAPFSDPTIAVTWGAQTLPPGLCNPVEHLCQRLYGYDKPDAPPVRVARTRTVLGANMATRRDLWETYPFPNIAQAEDYAYFHHFVRRGCAGMFIPGAIVVHGHSENFLRGTCRSLYQSFLQGMILANVIPYDAKKKEAEIEW